MEAEIRHWGGEGGEGGRHRLEGRGGMGGWGIAELWARPGNFYSHVVTETLVHHRGICSPKQPTGGPSDNTWFNMWYVGCREAASRRPQRLPGTSKGPRGGAPSDYHREPLSDRPGTALHAKKEVPSGRKLDLDNVERRETYIGTGGGLHNRY